MVSRARASSRCSTSAPGGMVRASDPACRATPPPSRAPSSSWSRHCQSAVPSTRKSYSTTPSRPTATMASEVGSAARTTRERSTRLPARWARSRWPRRSSAMRASIRAGTSRRARPTATLAGLPPGAAWNRPGRPAGTKSTSASPATATTPTPSVGSAGPVTAPRSSRRSAPGPGAQAPAVRVQGAVVPVADVDRLLVQAARPGLGQAAGEGLAPEQHIGHALALAAGQPGRDQGVDAGQLVGEDQRPAGDDHDHAFADRATDPVDRGPVGVVEPHRLGLAGHAVVLPQRPADVAEPLGVRGLAHDHDADVVAGGGGRGVLPEADLGVPGDLADALPDCVG